jgi:divalent metal cation (Fe/Co/Zn/Cd) transporter
VTRQRGADLLALTLKAAGVTRLFTLSGNHIMPLFDAALDAALRRETEKHGLKFHALRHRDAGEMHYVEVHLLFADDIMLRDAHRTATEIEHAVQASVDRSVLITTHLECQGDHDELHQHGEASDPNAKRA